MSCTPNQPVVPDVPAFLGMLQRLRPNCLLLRYGAFCTRSAMTHKATDDNMTQIQNNKNTENRQHKQLSHATEASRAKLCAKQTAGQLLLQLPILQNVPTSEKNDDMFKYEKK